MNPSITYNFPATTFSESNSIAQQLEHVLSEVEEVCEAIETNECPERVDEELVDLFHSLETLLRIMQRTLGNEYAEDLFQMIEEKNRARGYYAQPVNNQEQ